ncbi:GGDEF domain-containing protein [Streptomyces boncukensis]|uniref:Sensor domain-containing diguanylate cyclase n=1 Tax=Streptomyces boncukensis TaxID=2711219 RepID=A0A6G4WUC8_9ACTN|nr:sensor domain-containing diguanylate cyclase [Streptomyces boncukensis]NGO68889.1 sensor domain-containing diguanylate cyclase [Streptomyces boncukensis]
MGDDADARLCAVAALARAMAAAHTASPLPRGDPRSLPHRALAHAAARGALEALGGSFAAVSRWERGRGRLRVLANAGELAGGEERFPDDESYPVHDFPEITEFLHEEWARCGEPPAWVETLDGPPSGRIAALRRRGRGSCVVAPLVLHGRAWGELYVARGVGEPVFAPGDARFATVLAALVASGLAQDEHLEEVRRLAFTDPLTGLANRRAVDSGLDEALELHRSEGTVVSLAICDLNGLKRVNDEQGHEAGDRLLERFSSVLSLSAALLPGALAGRLGGDEFCLLAVGPTADEVVRAADELCRRAAELELGEGVACGIVSTGDPVGEIRTARRLFRLADAAQYRAKAARSPKPVVAGRDGGPDDPVVHLADAPAAPPPGERRRIRRLSG